MENDRLGDVMSQNCPSRDVLRHMTSRWGLLILMALETDVLRFSELRRRIEGISERMLAQTLNNLEGYGLVLRTDYQEVPPHVDYRLTPLGRDATIHVRGLLGWIEGNIPDIMQFHTSINAADKVAKSNT